MLTDSEVVIANECIKMLQLFEEIITSEISAKKMLLVVKSYQWYIYCTIRYSSFSQK